MEPLRDAAESFAEYSMAGGTLGTALQARLESVAGKAKLALGAVDFFWPSDELLAELAAAETPLAVKLDDGTIAAWASKDGRKPEAAVETALDDDSILVRYPWDLLTVNERVVGALTRNDIQGEIAETAVVDGILALGKGSRILPGVYIEGNATIGENCKIGPNCYIRGNTHIGDGCHVGQAVEIKNSILMDNVSAGHLAYVGDSIAGPEVNFGAGTITANLRHDGENQKSKVEGELLDTGRRKLGCVFGRAVHTGIHTSVYPGRKMWSGTSTAPGEIVRTDLRPGNWDLGNLDRRSVEEPFPGK
jgi:bifunctional UDP-N-acetylglucosamine pyrophosphorylase/glucosamine-1-phosphate N-acetyltransferase